MNRESLLFHADFRRLWIGDAISQVGTMVTMLAMPLLAVKVLHATPFQVGLLTTFEFLAFLVIGLPAGAWVDRMRRRSVMITADLGRVVTLGSVPVVGAFGALTMWQLYAVVLITGGLTVFFDVSYQSYLPFLVGRERLVEGNAKLQGTQSVAQVAGPSLERSRPARPDRAPRARPGPLGRGDRRAVLRRGGGRSGARWSPNGSPPGSDRAR